MEDKILVLDFGSQYNQLIARRIREFGVYSELCDSTISPEAILEKKNVRGLVFSGGPNSVYDDNAPDCDPRIFDMGVPILGICYGMQLIQQLRGGKVRPGEKREYGRSAISVKEGSLLFEGLPAEQIVWMSHGDQVTELAPGFRNLAASPSCPNAAACDPENNI